MLPNWASRSSSRRVILLKRRPRHQVSPEVSYTALVREFDENLEVTLSGGGYRASAFGLGTLLYLAHSDLRRQVVSISSVSGGSITNGFVAQECDFAGTDVDDFKKIASRLVHKISGEGFGKYSGFWLVSRFYLGFLIVSLAPIVFWYTSIVVRRETGTELAVAGFVGLSWLVAGLSRGEVVRVWMSRHFFPGKPTLGSLSEKTVDHVFCATDLGNSQPFFFSTKGGGRLYSERHGLRTRGDVGLEWAVSASAAFPPLIPPMRLGLTGPRRRPYVYLSDGGVWNNLGTDWSRLIRSLPALLWQERAVGGVLLIANASRPEQGAELWKLKIPLISFFLTIIRVMIVMVNSTVAGRSDDVERTARARMLNNPGRWEFGKGAGGSTAIVSGQSEESDPPLTVLVEVSRQPGQTAQVYRSIGGLEQWRKKVDEYLRDLGESLSEELEEILKGTDVPTTLDNIRPEDALRLVVLGYWNTRETLAVAFANHTPPPMPPLEWFKDLLTDQPRTS